MILDVVLWLTLAQAPLDSARTRAGMTKSDAVVPALCSSELRTRLRGYELLCETGAPVASEVWLTPKRDASWQVRVDVISFAEAKQAQAAARALKELTTSSSAWQRPDGGHAPRLSWCETSYVLMAQRIAVVSVACGAIRPWCAATRALRAEGGTEVIVGAAGGSARVVSGETDVCP